MCSQSVYAKGCSDEYIAHAVSNISCIAGNILDKACSGKHRCRELGEGLSTTVRIPSISSLLECGYQIQIHLLLVRMTGTHTCV